MRKSKRPRVLLVCSMGLNRSKYLAAYLKNKGHPTRFGGIGFGRIHKEAHNPFKQEDIDWADIIITARKRHRPLIKKKFKLHGEKIIVLDVTDSRRIIGEQHPEFRGLEFAEFQRKWTRPQLRKSLRPYLPLKFRKKRK